MHKILKIADIADIKINHIDFRLGYNEKYNIYLWQKCGCGSI
jgi:hypothetical protein